MVWWIGHKLRFVQRPVEGQSKAIFPHSHRKVSSSLQIIYLWVLSVSVWDPLNLSSTFALVEPVDIDLSSRFGLPQTGFDDTGPTRTCAFRVISTITSRSTIKTNGKIRRLNFRCQVNLSFRDQGCGGAAKKCNQQLVFLSVIDKVENCTSHYGLAHPSIRPLFAMAFVWAKINWMKDLKFCASLAY